MPALDFATLKTTRLPRVLPSGVVPLDEREDGIRYLWTRGDGPMTIIASFEQHGGRDWLHVSCARPDRLPSWSDLKMLKRLFYGPEGVAIQVLPPESEYVNVHPGCLHLYGAIDEGPRIVPDFTMGSGTL